MAAGGLGYDDLNELMKSPEDLEFIIELLAVESVKEYEKVTFQSGLRIRTRDQTPDPNSFIKSQGLYKVLFNPISDRGNNIGEGGQIG